MEVKLENFDKQRIERIKKLSAELYGEPADSDWAVISAALRIFEIELKRDLKKKRGE